MTAPLQSGAEGAAGESFGSPAGEAFGVGVGDALPFTGALLTVPLAILGLVLTFSGWVVRRMGRDIPTVE